MKATFERPVAIQFAKDMVGRTFISFAYEDDSATPYFLVESKNRGEWSIDSKSTMTSNPSVSGSALMYNADTNPLVEIKNLKDDLELMARSHSQIVETFKSLIERLFQSASHSNG